MRRLVLLLALAALAAPALARADATYGSSSFVAGPRSTGDGFNSVTADAASGRVTVVRYNPVPSNSQLGCAGKGGFGFLKVLHTSATSLRVATVHFTEALVDPYTFVKVRVADASGYVLTESARGPILGDGSLSVDVSGAVPAVSGAVSVEFGLEVTSACPNVDGGTLRFTSVAITEAP